MWDCGLNFQMWFILINHNYILKGISSQGLLDETVPRFTTGAVGQARILTQAPCFTGRTLAPSWIKHLSLPFRNHETEVAGHPVDGQLARP